MNQSPVGSFLKFVIGFTIFIGVSFGVTFAVQKFAGSQDAAQQQAAAAAAMLVQEK
jgi:hypothetical protein